MEHQTQDRRPKPGEFYRHFKNKMYQIITVAIHSETREEMVVYQALYDDFKTYVRPLEMFVSEVDHEKYPEVEQKYRFERVLPEDGANKEEVNKEEIHIATAVNAKNVEVDINNANAESVEADIKSAEEESVEEQANPFLLQFLDTETYEEKYKMIKDRHAELTDRLVNDIAVVLDVVIPEGPLDKRIEQLKSCLATMCKYEVTRLR